MPQPPRVAVLHIRSSRPHAPAFQAELDMLNEAAREALAAEGWAAELVAVTERPADEVRGLARAADVVLVMGGEDVVPALYGGLAEYPGSGMHEPEADRVTFDVIRDAVADRRPAGWTCDIRCLIGAGDPRIRRGGHGGPSGSSAPGRWSGPAGRCRG